MLTFIAKTKKEALQKMLIGGWFSETVLYLKKIKNSCDHNEFSLEIALELFEISLDKEHIDYNQVSSGDTPFTNKFKKMITHAYCLISGDHSIPIVFCLFPNKIEEVDIYKRLDNVRSGIYLNSDIDDIENYIILLEEKITLFEKGLDKNEM